MLNVLIQYIVKNVLKLSGGIGWLAGQALDILAEYLGKLLKDKKRDAEQAKERKELEDVAKNPEKTPEEIAKEYEDAINAGRK